MGALVEMILTWRQSQPHLLENEELLSKAVLLENMPKVSVIAMCVS
jgi:hypothetical protein